MVTLLIIILALGAGVLTFKASTNGVKFESSKPETLIIPAVKSVAAAIGLLVLLLIQPYRFEVIDAGCVGIQVNLIGSDRGVGNYEYKTGIVPYNKWTQRIIELPLSQQHVSYPNQKVTTYGGFVADISPSFNYSIKQHSAGDMFVNLRKPLAQIENEWLQTAVTTTINDVSNKWKIDSIFTRRQEFESNIIAEVNKKVSKWFVLSQLRTNMLPPDALVRSINDKTKAAQDVQVAEQRKKVAIAEGIMKKAEAQADSIVLVTRAAAEAKANQLKQAVLTPKLIKQQWIEAWKAGGSQVPKIVTGSGSNMIFSLPDDKD